MKIATIFIATAILCHKNKLLPKLNKQKILVWNLAQIVRLAYL